MPHDLPARSFRENDVILMFISISLDELDAREVFPMLHCLLEEGFVHPTEVAVDLVRDHSVVPDSLLSGSGRPSDPMARSVVFVIGYCVFPLQIEVWLEFVHWGYFRKSVRRTPFPLAETETVQQQNSM